MKKGNVIHKKGSVTYRALLIGINYNGQSIQLTGCIRDIYKIKELLKTEGFNDIVCMTDEPKNKNTLLYPTYDNIITQINKTVKSMCRGDHLFFCYSGHGANEISTNPKLEKNCEFIVPCDMLTAQNPITDDQLIQLLVYPLDETMTFRATFDCCHSQHILDTRYICYYDTTIGNGKSRTTTAQSKLVYEENPSYGLTKCDCILLSGCKDNQTSLETSEDGAEKVDGVLSYYFCKYFSKAKRNPTPLNVLHYISTKCIKNGFDQIPVLSSGNDVKHFINENFF